MNCKCLRHTRCAVAGAMLLLTLVSGHSLLRSAFAEEAEVGFTPAQLRELVAPVALYPDPVLASLLPATTFPLDVVMAARWDKEHAESDDADPTVHNWDESVHALMQFPDIVAWLNDNLEWMDQMGAAVAVQQGEVLQAIQDFRREALEAGNLASGSEMLVTEQPALEVEGARPPLNATVIVLQPTNPQVVYVPSYDPYVVTLRRNSAGPLALTFALRFSLGDQGAWGRHELGWGWWDHRLRRGVRGSVFHYRSGRHYYGSARTSTPQWGPYRPTIWSSPRSARARHTALPSHRLVRPTPVRAYFPNRVARPGGMRRSDNTAPVRRVRPLSPAPSTILERGVLERGLPGRDRSSERGRTSLGGVQVPGVRIPRPVPSNAPVYRVASPRPAIVPAPSLRPNPRPPTRQVQDRSRRGRQSLTRPEAPAPAPPPRRRVRR